MAETLDPAEMPAADYCDPPPFTVEAQGQTMRFYPAGRDRLDALIELIDSATESLNVCFYIFAEDATAIKVRDAMAAAARRGVAVKLVIDGFGAAASDAFFEPLAAAGGRYWRFSARWSQRYLIRNHQKMVIVDRQRAMIGGFNIEDSYFAPPHENGWNDLGLIVEGSVVGMLGRWFAKMEEWVSSPRAQWRAIRRIVREWDPGEGPVRLVVGGPTRGLSTWARVVSDDLIRGQRLDMMMAYFSPPKRLVRRIARIAANGQTRLLMAGKSDNGATIGATRALYRYLLKRRARIWEFAACKLHTKLIVLDDRTYVGSANFDMRSLYINLELMLVIDDPALADRMRDFIGQHLPASLEITPQLHAKRATLWNRLRWRVSWFLVAVLDYTVSRRLNLGL
ncbi:phospholipase D-like domain-containing protein [Croceicoccus bisphenolivorans]|uniref:phospholipase D-like domain-containing protein n=1 Tax=Croceicoccus bisphenolivorans TaxID=1783232 RepID=UPI00082C38C3|nr:cardiolipin synthase B [Croceicoccus bisphenolivorans]